MDWFLHDKDLRNVKLHLDNQPWINKPAGKNCGFILVCMTFQWTLGMIGLAKIT